MASTRKVATKQRSTAKQPAVEARAATAPKPAAPAAGPWAATFAPRTPGERRHWLVKSEPSVFSFDDLFAAPKRTTCWDGVRNFTARNFMRDGMKLGDGVFFYHSMTDRQAIVGTCEVVRESYPDHTATTRGHAHFDPGSDAANPTWCMVDLRAVERLPRPVALTAIKARPELAAMALLRIGRLSVTPVTVVEWRVICELGGATGK